MQNYEKFWHGSLPQGNNQLLIDIDTFINHFCGEITKHTSIQLNNIQKKYLKAKIDPENQNQVYKNAYLLFIKDYWSIASNRTRLFNMKMNLKEIKMSKQSLQNPTPMAGSLKITVFSGANEIQQYVLKDNLIYSEKNEIKLKNEGFLTIGSAEHNQISIDSVYANQQHLKIIYSSNLEQDKNSSPSFMKQPKLVTKFFMRDIAKSHRLKYILNNENKYFVLKKGMKISLGLMEGFYEVTIDDVNEVDESKLNHLQYSMNEDRISFVPGIPNKPIKSVINFDLSKITEPMVTDMYDRGLFYPQKNKLNSPSKKKKQENNCFLKWTIQNMKTLERKKYVDKNLKKIRIGRDEDCQVVMDEISIRPIEFMFQAINEMWFLRNVEGVDVGIELGCQSQRNSNRLVLGEQYPQILRIKKGLEIHLEVEKQKEDEDDF